jgi:hypothetical protein
MNRTRTVGAAVVVLAGIIVCGVAFAQAPASPPTTSPAPEASASTSTKPSPAVQSSLDRKAVGSGEEDMGHEQCETGGLPEAVEHKETEGGKRWSFLYKCTTR